MSDYSKSYFGVEWDSEKYEKPWNDTRFLRKVYESEQAPTQEEIGDELGCSGPTISNWMPDDAERGGPGPEYEHISMFSGGYDSLVATHYAMEELDAEVVLHIDTGTGIHENRQFVESVCKWFDWPLEVITPNKTLVEFAVEYGFPKAPSHSWIYRYLKEHSLSRFTTSLQCDKPTYYTGVRKDESQRRMENVSAETTEMWGGRWFWEAPIAEWSDQDCADYIVENGLPRNPVAETIGRSGECFCGAYADRFGELLTLKEHYPDHYEWIMEVEQEVQNEIGTDEDYCYWGASGVSSEELQSLMDAEDSSDMTLCVDCEGEGHRNLGHEQDPTYETVYIAGPRCDGENPFSFHERIATYDETVNWINPFTLNDYDTEQEARRNKGDVYSTDLHNVSNSDAVLVRRVDDYNLCGATIESAIAIEKLGIPVVVYNDAESDVPLMLEALATDVVDDERVALQRVLSLARQSLRREGESVLVK